MKKKLNNNIEKSYCSFEVSKLLKNKGFDITMDENLFMYPDGSRVGNEILEKGNKDINKLIGLKQPTHAIAIEWIRVNFGIWILIDIDDIKRSLCNYVVKWHNDICFNEARGKGYRTPQEATEVALLFVLQQLIK